MGVLFYRRIFNIPVPNLLSGSILIRNRPGIYLGFAGNNQIVENP
jgi:hypothetical protein